MQKANKRDNQSNQTEETVNPADQVSADAGQNTEDRDGRAS